MISKRKIKQWLADSMNKISITSNAIDLHLEIDIIKDFEGKDIFLELAELFQELKLYIHENREDVLKLELNIELNPSTEIYKLKNHTSLIDKYDRFSDPELIMYIPDKEYFMPKIEYYFKPLYSIKEHINKDSFDAFYECYKHNDLEEEYTNWVTYRYLNPSNNK